MSEQQPADEPVIDMGYLSLPAEVQQAAEADVAARRASPSPAPAGPSAATAVPSAPVSEAAVDEPAWTPEQIAEFKVRFEAAMAKYAPLRVLPSEHWKDRAEAAEAKLAAAESRAGEMEERYDRVTLSLRDLEAAEAKLAEVRAVLLEGGQDDGTVRRRALAIIGTDEEAAFARHLVAQAKAADAEYKVAAVRAALYTFLHQHGRSPLPAFKAAIDLAVSLRKIIDDLGSEEPRDG